MGDTQHFCLRWNNYQSSITSAFENLRDDEDFVDVTLACDGKSLKAHRVVLSACSPYFRELLKSTPCKHPVIVLQDVAFADLHALVEFIYHGEVNVHQRNLSSFLKTAEVLRVSGLTQQPDDKDEGLAGRHQHNFTPDKCEDGLFASPPSPGAGNVGGATVNQLLRRAALHSNNARRERRNSDHLSDSSDPPQPPPQAKRPRPHQHDNGETPLPDYPPPPRVSRKPPPPPAVDENMAPDRDDSPPPLPSPPPLLDGVKSEPLDTALPCQQPPAPPPPEGDPSDDSNEEGGSHHRQSDPEEGDGGGKLPTYLGPDSKLFSPGSFNFSMAALAADPTALSGLATQNLQGNVDGTAGTSSQGGGLVHYRIPPPTSGGINEPQECPYCRRTFSCYYSLKRHFQDKHERSDTLYVCEFCQRRYRTKNSLTTHKSLQHRGSSGMLKRLLKNSAIHNVLGQAPGSQ